MLAAVTAIAAAVAIGLGIYAMSLNGQLDDTQAALSAQEDAAAVLADAECHDRLHAGRLGTARRLR